MNKAKQKSPEKLSRKIFLFTAGTGLLAALTGLWAGLVRKQKFINKQKNRKMTLKVNTQELVSFKEEWIFTFQNNKLLVLSAQCTHLGCLINQTQGEQLVCPCHGSRFKLNGEVIQGPATENLRILPYTVKEKDANKSAQGIMTIEISES